MTIGDFANWAQAYYGPYPEGQKRDVYEYLKALSPEELDELRVRMRATCESHIRQVNGYPPDIGGMERIMPEVKQVVEGRARERRELGYAAKMLPAPGEPTDEDLVTLDWSKIFRDRISHRIPV